MQLLSRGAQAGSFWRLADSLGVRRAAARLPRLVWALALGGAAAGCATPPSGPDPRVLEARPVFLIDERGQPAQRAAHELARQVADDATAGELLAAHLAHVEGTLAAPLVLGNEARVLIDGPATHRAMFRAIAEARRHVHLETYTLEPGEPGERLAALLTERRAAGVEVRVLYDSVGSLATPPEYFERLRAAGIELCAFNPVISLRRAVWRLNNRDHRKLLVVDGRVAFTGGINISSAYRAGSSGSSRAPPSVEEGWRDTHVAVEGPVVGEFQNLFLANWRRQRCAALPPGDEVTPGAPGSPRGDKLMRLLAADPEAGRSDFYVALLSAIDHARRRVWITNGYFVPDDGLLQGLIGAARRGVDVRLVLPGFSDFWAPFHAGRSHYSVLLAVGVRILERHDAMLHAKTVVIDGVWSSIGSTNLDWRSFVHNYEADLLLLDPAFGREMERMFQRDAQRAREIDPAAWARRGLGDRLLEWFARRWAYLL